MLFSSVGSWAAVNGSPEGLRLNTEGNYISYNVHPKPRDLCWVIRDFPNERTLGWRAAFKDKQLGSTYTLLLGMIL